MDSMIKDHVQSRSLEKIGFLQAKKSMLDILVLERKALELEFEKAIKHDDGVTANKIIGKLEALRDLERKVFALEFSSLHEH